MTRLALLPLLGLATACTITSLPPSSSRVDGGPVAARGVVTHEARSQLRLYRDAAGCESVQAVNRQFRLVNTWNRQTGALRRLVLEEAYDVRHCLTSESGSTEAVITAWLPDSATKEPLFRLSGRGVRGDPRRNLYQMVARGCCGAQNLFTYFSLLTGRQLFASSLPALELEPPDRQSSWFAGIHDTYSAGPPPELANDSAVVGVVAWANDSQPGQRLAVRAVTPEPFAAASLRFVRAGKVLADSILAAGADLGPLELEVRLVAPGSERAARLLIPIASGRLWPERARVSPGFSLRQTP